MTVRWPLRARWARGGRHALGRFPDERGGPLNSLADKKIMRRGEDNHMSDAHTTQPPANPHEAEGHGKHRGQISAHEAETSPHGRHRKPAGQTESTTVV